MKKKIVAMFLQLLLNFKKLFFTKKWLSQNLSQRKTIKSFFNDFSYLYKDQEKIWGYVSRAVFDL